MVIRDPHINEDLLQLLLPSVTDVTDVLFSQCRTYQCLQKIGITN